MWPAELRTEVEALFYTPHPLDPTGRVPDQLGEVVTGWSFFELEDPDVSRERHARNASLRKRLGLCVRCAAPLADGSKNHCAKHVVANRPSARKAREPRKVAEGDCPHHHRPLKFRLADGMYYCPTRGCATLERRP